MLKLSCSRKVSWRSVERLFPAFASKVVNTIFGQSNWTAIRNERLEYHSRSPSSSPNVAGEIEHFNCTARRQILFAVEATLATRVFKRSLFQRGLLSLVVAKIAEEHAIVISARTVDGAVCRVDTPVRSVASAEMSADKDATNSKPQSLRAIKSPSLSTNVASYLTIRFRRRTTTSLEEKCFQMLALMLRRVLARPRASYDREVDEGLKKKRVYHTIPSVKKDKK